MGFPVVSTSVETKACRRFIRVMQRSKVARLIHEGQVFNCRVIAGTNEYSQHAWGNAVDLMAAGANLRDIAYNAVDQGTQRTLGNRGRLCRVERVIYETREWRRGSGWFAYTGEPHTDHVHVDFWPNRTGTPPCA